MFKRMEEEEAMKGHFTQKLAARKVCEDCVDILLRDDSGFRLELLATEVLENFPKKIRANPVQQEDNSFNY